MTFSNVWMRSGLAALVFVVTGCAATGPSRGGPADSSGSLQWRRIHARTAFSFSAPSDVHVAVPKGVGIDSYVGEYEAPGMRIRFGFGIYGGCFESEGQSIRVKGGSGSLHLRDAQLDRDGEYAALPFVAQLCAKKKVKRGYVPLTLSMSIYCASERDRAVAIRILRSVEVHCVEEMSEQRARTS